MTYTGRAGTGTGSPEQMLRVLAVGGPPARPTRTQRLLDESPEARVSMVETGASARIVLEDEEFDACVIECPDVRAAEQLLALVLDVAPLLPAVVATDADGASARLFDLGAAELPHRLESVARGPGQRADERLLAGQRVEERALPGVGEG